MQLEALAAGRDVDDPPGRVVIALVRRAGRGKGRHRAEGSRSCVRSLLSQIFKTGAATCFIVGTMNDTNVQDTDAAADIDVLDGVLTKTADLLDGVQPDQRGLSTPCPDYDV